MEKRTPHHSLSDVKTLIQEARVRSTVSALAGAAALGFDFDRMLGVLKAITQADFYKSMTTHSDHRLWQDVYRPTTAAGEVYVKLTALWVKC
jgi:motility quorum-sensing regulator/GCU-specific mRNA interferase toxin